MLPNIADPFDRERARDEMPQSAGQDGDDYRRIHTEKAVNVTLSKFAFRVKMTTGGYIIPDALGHIEKRRRGHGYDGVFIRAHALYRSPETERGR